MAKRSAKKLADPTRIQPFDPKTGLLQVVVETPKGSRNKFAFDPKREVFTLKAVLPAGMVFPYEFGFVPRTRAEDGDGTDVLLLMDEPAFPGLVVPARLVGVIQGEQIDGKKRIRNDRLVAAAVANHQYKNIHRMSDLPKHFVDELEEFFVNYHKMEGKQYKLLGVKGADVALKAIKKTRI